jgi:hypothetical protein
MNIMRTIASKSPRPPGHKVLKLRAYHATLRERQLLSRINNVVFKPLLVVFSDS